ncbi:hypothetical protein CEXT_313021 [Caerostris extrusa]|uniref:Uncharacterized protein n=1 Tax=Caerostris extrusa TaxID=172846 RepID=A0AAV4MDD2_CAEEX|nr:hypothetical protein CEXT_313021 [Caerostris extrusa]
MMLGGERYLWSLLRILLKKMLSNLTDEERCARISRIFMKKGIAQSLLDTFNATIFGHALDEDDRTNLKALVQDLINAVREVGNLEICPLIDCKKHKANVNNSSVNLKRKASLITTVNDDNSEKVNC